VLRGQADNWAPLDQALLPIISTAFNTLLLLASGLTMWFSVSAVADGRQRTGKNLLAVTGLLGLTFVVLQGTEWIALIEHGLTSSSSIFASLFYTIVGCHALHVVSALIALGVVFGRAARQRYTPANYDGLLAMRMYWIFVVLVWPPLYVLVYLW